MKNLILKVLEIFLAILFLILILWFFISCYNMASFTVSKIEYINENYTKPNEVLNNIKVD